jgi:Tfp pilus assembly protein PilN
MSTTFGIPKEPIEIELGDEDGIYYYINPDIFEKVFFRTMYNSRWLNDLAKSLPDKTKVYALDNTQQGVYTIGDIKELMKDGKSNN